MPTSGSVSGAAPFPASDARDTEIHDAEVPIPTALLTKAPIIETPVTGAPAAAIPDTTMRFMPMPVDLVRFVASVKPGTPDAWLYLCCPDAETAAETLADGLIPDRTTPPVLHEAEAAIAWLAECDDSGGAPNRTGARQSGPSLLRVRRALVESSVESDPDGSYRPGHRVYLLTGGGEGG